MLASLAMIEDVFKELIGDDDLSNRQPKGPLYVLYKILQAFIIYIYIYCKINCMTKLEMGKKSQSSFMVLKHQLGQSGEGLVSLGLTSIADRFPPAAYKVTCTTSHTHTSPILRPTLAAAFSTLVPRLCASKLRSRDNGEAREGGLTLGLAFGEC